MLLVRLPEPFDYLARQAFLGGLVGISIFGITTILLTLLHILRPDEQWLGVQFK